MDECTLAKFMAKVAVQPNGCWHWTGHISKDGYGKFYVAEHGQSQLAHRVSYMHFMGEGIPADLILDHLCHTLDKSCPGGVTCLHRRCVNPATLQPVTQQVNNNRGRGPSARNAAKTHCDKGHEFTSENTYVDPDGGRECRTCRKALGEKWLREHHPGVQHGTETHCPAGHEYAGTNLYVRPRDGARICRQCKRDWNREDMRRRRAQARADREQARIDRELADMLDMAVLLEPEPAGPLTLF